MIKYDKSLITKLVKNNDYKLSEKVIDIINSLTEKVGDPDYIKTPQFEKLNKNEKDERVEKYYNKFKKKLDADEWNIIRNFETTDFKKKEGMDQYIDIIRKYLNKMTDKTFLTSQEKIIETLDLICQIATIDELTGISDTVFNIVSSNIFYSEMYASLYKDLFTKYEFFKLRLDNNFVNYKEVIQNIKYVDSNNDYDEFCKNNKLNENNRALLLFYVNLMKKDIINKENIMGMIIYIYEIYFELMEQDNKKGEIEELSELLYILIKNSYEKLNECDDWNNIYSNIEFISKLKIKDKLSITNKAIFKHMDILDEFS